MRLLEGRVVGDLQWVQGRVVPEGSVKVCHELAISAREPRVLAVVNGREVLEVAPVKQYLEPVRLWKGRFEHELAVLLLLCLARFLGRERLMGLGWLLLRTEI